MRSPFSTFRAGVAAGLSLWMAVLACFVGCTLPAFAKPESSSASVQEPLAHPTQADLMADMENCPHHHSEGDAPAKPNGGKPVHGGAMSCCPLEITVNQKWTPTALGIVPHVVLMQSNVSLTVQFHSAMEFESPVWHSGRDTLLETRLLRI
jgi:hypothetical protein